MRLLVAAGLSLIDDLESLQEKAPEADLNDLENRITLVERTAAAALSEAAQRINAIASRVEAG